MKNGNKSGVIVVEASIVVTLVVAVITVMLYIGMVMYQQTLASVMAEQTASNLAQVYGNNLKDPATGYIDADKVYRSVTYGNMKTDAYTDVVRQKAEAFARYRLKSSRILASDSVAVDVDIVKKEGELLKNQIVVKVKDKYDVPLVGLFGVDGLVEFDATGYADCVDILEYINGVDAVSGAKHSNLDAVSELDACTVCFIPEKNDPLQRYVVTVIRGESIISSNKYTNSVMPQDPTSTKCDFVGWTDGNGHTFTATTTVGRDMTVYGKWECFINFDANGGTVNGGSAYGKTVPLGEKTTMPTPTRDTYEFLGWYDSKGVEYISNGTPINENVVLTAKWKRIMLKVTFDANGGSLPNGYSNSQDVVCGEKTEMPLPLRMGYVFQGWYDEGDTEYTDETTITRSVTLHAEWSKCTQHVAGDCGVDHRGLEEAGEPFHAGKGTSYFGATEFRCLVCSNCGALLDGYNNVSKFGLGDFHNTSGVSKYIWCTKHIYDENGNEVYDCWWKKRTAGEYAIHNYKQ